MDDRKTTETAEELRARLSAYRAMKEAAWALRQLERENRHWWAFDHHPVRDRDEPQTRLRV